VAGQSLFVGRWLQRADAQGKAKRLPIGGLPDKIVLTSTQPRWEANMKSFIVTAGILVLLAPAAFAQTLPCPSLNDPIVSKAREGFVLPYRASSEALREGRYVDVMALTSAAAPEAVDAMQLQAVLSVRTAALIQLGDDAGLAATLEKRITVDCFTQKGEAEDVARQLEAVRARLEGKTPP
jgi:hypothetical protein